MQLSKTTTKKKQASRVHDAHGAVLTFDLERSFGGHCLSLFDTQVPCSATISNLHSASLFLVFFFMQNALPIWSTFHSMVMMKMMNTLTLMMKIILMTMLMNMLMNILLMLHIWRVFVVMSTMTQMRRSKQCVCLCVFL